MGANGSTGSSCSEVGVAGFCTDSQPSYTARDTGTERISRSLVGAYTTRVVENGNDCWLCHTDLYGDALDRAATNSRGADPFLLAEECSRECLVESLPLSGFGTDTPKQSVEHEEGLCLFFSTSKRDRRAADVSGGLLHTLANVVGDFSP